MDGVRALLQRPLEEGHNIRLVLPQLDILGLQLLVPLLEPPAENNNQSYASNAF